MGEKERKMKKKKKENEEEETDCMIYSLIGHLLVRKAQEWASGETGEGAGSRRYLLPTSTGCALDASRACRTVP